MTDEEPQIAHHIRPESALRVYVYHGASKKLLSPEELCGYDVVITTYGKHDGFDSSGSYAHFVSRSSFNRILASGNKGSTICSDAYRVSPTAQKSGISN